MTDKQFKTGTHSVSSTPLPLVYSCSGCSNIAQLANQVAIELYREDKAEMSCIAGVGGGVASLINVAKSGRPIIALDGCPLHCVKSCLHQHGITADYHYTLTEYGIKKHPKLNFDPADVLRIKAMLMSAIDNPTLPKTDSR